VQAGVDRHTLMHAVKIANAKMKDAWPQPIAVIAKPSDVRTE